MPPRALLPHPPFLPYSAVAGGGAGGAPPIITEEIWVNRWVTHIQELVLQFNAFAAKKKKNTFA